MNLGFEVPPGFEVSLYADDSLATDIHSLTIDARGRVVVASKGYVKILHDTDGDGRADKATLFSDRPKSGAHGMYFDGNDLIANGDNGVRRYRDRDGDGRCDDVSDVWLPTKNDGEHAANGILRGPDGAFYMICGNDAGIGQGHVTQESSPIRQPIAGAVVRFGPDGQDRAVIADGFRNPYDFAFNELGHLFTVDSDGERVHYLPYYTPNRLYDIAQGMNHGWILPGWQRGWARPAAWPDNVDRLVEIGRGSPTGVVVYRHRAFPERYRGGVFSLCWTFGRVYFFPLAASGSTYRSKLEVFMRTTGDVGFAPTDMAVAPDGDLFIAIGGRGTRGSVFRVRYRGPEVTPPLPADPLRAILAADEPLSSWARARWVPQAQRLGALAFAGAVVDARLPLTERIRAVEVLTELFGGVPCATAREVLTPPDLVARVLWSLSRGKPSDEACDLVAANTASRAPRVARAAWEALGSWPEPWSREHARQVDMMTPLAQPDRRVHAAFLQAVRRHGSISNRLALAVGLRGADVGQQLAALWTSTPPAVHLSRHLDAVLEALSAESPLRLRMDAVRLLQLGLGDVVVADGADKTAIGYVAQEPNRLDGALRQRLARHAATLLPSGSAGLDRELARLAAMLGEDVPDLPARIAAHWTRRSSAEDDIHYLLVLSRLPSPRTSEVTRQTAAALNGIHTKLAKLGARPSDQVPAVLEQLCDRLLERDPNLAAAIVADGAFGAPGHEIYALRLPPLQKQAAARKLLARIRRLDEEQARAAWSPELVRLVSSLPEEESLPILRGQFADPRLSDSIALILAGKRHEADRARLVTALSSPQPRVVSAAAEALRELRSKAEGPVDLSMAVKALRRFTLPPGDATARKDVVRLLELWQPGAVQSGDAAAWTEWFSKSYPGEAATLLGMTGAGEPAWRARLSKVAWDKGDLKRGELVFQRKSCQRCHGDSRRLGPDLAGVGQRFSRDDLFVAIVEPSKDIAPAYLPSTITTTAGKVYSGMLIYQSPEVTLLQTTPDTTVRIPGAEVQLLEPGRISFMPAGLLDDASDAELADLYAFLRTLQKR